MSPIALPHLSGEFDPGEGFPPDGKWRALGDWLRNHLMDGGAFRSDDSLSGSSLVAAADAFFGSLNRGFAIKVRDSGQDEDLRAACLEAGLELFGDPVPEMVCRSPLELPPPAVSE